MAGIFGRGREVTANWLFRWHFRFQLLEPVLDDDDGESSIDALVGGLHLFDHQEASSVG